MTFIVHPIYFGIGHNLTKFNALSFITAANHIKSRHYIIIKEIFVEYFIYS
jgi:hypothetical protein